MKVIPPKGRQEEREFLIFLEQNVPPVMLLNNITPQTKYWESKPPPPPLHMELNLQTLVGCHASPPDHTDLYLSVLTQEEVYKTESPPLVVFSPSCVVDPPKRWDVEPKQELITRIMSWTFSLIPHSVFSSCPNWCWKFLERGQSLCVRSKSMQIWVVYYSWFFYTYRFLFCSPCRRSAEVKKCRYFTEMFPSLLFVDAFVLSNIKRDAKTAIPLFSTAKNISTVRTLWEPRDPVSKYRPGKRTERKCWRPRLSSSVLSSAQQCSC